MTVEEALAVLGLAEGADASEVRGAYLSAVKAHPPERDAEGFQRVRKAYELLRRREAPPRAVLGQALAVFRATLETQDLAWVAAQRAALLALIERLSTSG